jgi:hypothetical protein
MRTFESAAPVAVVSSPELQGVPSIRDLADYTMQTSVDPPTSGRLQLNLRNLGGGVVSVIAPGASLSGENVFTFTVTVNESTPDAITRGTVGNTIVVDLETSSPPNFALSQTVGMTFLAGSSSLMNPTPTDGAPVPFVTSGVDGETGRNLTSPRDRGIDR